MRYYVKYAGLALRLPALPPNWRHSVRARGRATEKGFSLLEAIIIVAISLIMAALTAKSMLSAVNRYQVDTAARQIAALAQVAHMKAPAQNTRFQITPNITAGTYLLQMWDRNASNWVPDGGAAPIKLPPNVIFSTTGVTTAPPEQPTTVVQATEMTFNNVGLLCDPSTAACLVTDGRCFYIQSSAVTDAVCATPIGRTVVYRLSAGAWQQL